MGQPQIAVAEALDTIVGAVLPSLSLLLDGALDAAALARPGADAETHAAELRRIAEQLAGLTRLMAAVQAVQPAPAAPVRMSA